MIRPRVAALDALPALAGADLGTSGDRLVDQASIDAFAAITGDAQWIHTDPERASAVGGTIAHGLLVLSFVAGFWGDLLEVPDATRALNYGLDRVRFLAPVPVDATVRMRASVAEVLERPDGVRVSLDVAVESPGAERPALVARSIVLFQR